MRDEPICTVAEMMAGRWFVRRALEYRFVGIDVASCFRIRDRAAEICLMHIALRADSDPSATEERLSGLLDGVAEEIYPRGRATAWLESHPPIDDTHRGART